MPTPARTSLDEIVTAGRHSLEADGLDGLTMQRVAEIVGVRAPSLYKRVPSRGDLIRLIAEDVARELTESLDAVTTGDPRRDLRAMAEAMRTFAHANPASYSLIFTLLPDAWRPDPDLLARASSAVLRTTATMTGPDRALEVARTLVAWAHGFISMELAGAFRLGGSVDDAFAFGVERLATALAN
ncbi:MAG: WHG domain-containing protein [Jiangellaceae bacterium]